MKPRIFALALLLLTLVGVGCSKDPGEITLNLTLDNSISQTDKDAIQNFIFIVSDGSKKVLFPGDCVACKDRSSMCATENSCVKPTGCGFSKAEASFRPKVIFSEFPAASSITVTVCAVGDQTATVKGAGSTTLNNSAGVTGAIVLVADPSPCTPSFTTLCSP